jgi:hypothetical protein
MDPAGKALEALTNAETAIAGGDTATAQAWATIAQAYTALLGRDAQKFVTRVERTL